MTFGTEIKEGVTTVDTGVLRFVIVRNGTEFVVFSLSSFVFLEAKSEFNTKEEITRPLTTKLDSLSLQPTEKGRREIETDEERGGTG